MESLIKKKYGEYIRDLTSFGNPIFLIIISYLALGIGIGFMTIIIILIINELIGSFVKYFFHKNRPLKQKFRNAFEKIDSGSFPSIHSSRTMFTYLFIAYNRPETLIIMLLLIAVVGYSRIFLKKHFLIDVLGGYFLGLLLFFTSILI